MTAPSDSRCHALGRRAHRVTEKYELVTLTSALFDLDLLRIDYSVAGLPVSGMALRQVGADMDMDRIETWIDPDLQPQGLTDCCGEPSGTIRVIFKAAHIAPYDLKAQALVVHEGVHAAMRRRHAAPAVKHVEEAAAYLAQALVFELKGESIVQTWIDDNPWAFGDQQRHIDDPLQADSKARIYVAAEKLVEKFELDQRKVALGKDDVAELLAAIAKDPGYADPVRPRPKPPPPPSTLRERIRARRARRRARWAEQHGR
jgi:hypothetical protein